MLVVSLGEPVETDQGPDGATPLVMASRAGQGSAVNMLLNYGANPNSVLAAEGAKVVLSDIDAGKGEAAAESLRGDGAEAVFVACDVGDKSQVEALIAAAVATFGRLDCLVANAGIVKAADFLDFTEEDFDAVLRVNLKGVFLCGQAAARQMVKQGARTGGGAAGSAGLGA